MLENRRKNFKMLLEASIMRVVGDFSQSPFREGTPAGVRGGVGGGRGRDQEYEGRGKVQAVTGGGK